MSATQDKSQRTTFVFNNLYQLYKKNADSQSALDATDKPDKVEEVAKASLTPPVETAHISMARSAPVSLQEVLKSIPTAPISSVTNSVGLTRGVLLKAAAMLASGASSSLRAKVDQAEVQTYRAPALFRSNVIKAPIQLPVSETSKPVTDQLDNPALGNLKKNLEDLETLHQRLKFMLKEIEELTKKS